MRSPTFYNEAMVQGRTYDLLRRYTALRSEPPTLPIPIDLIAEDVCHLNILWEPIPEPPGQTILAGLDPDKRLVIFNETRRALYDELPFLERTVLAHEVGHWELHVDHAARVHPHLPGFERPFQFVCRRGAAGTGGWEERHAAWFVSHVLLPRDLLSDRLGGAEIASLGDMYRLRDTCEVTITVMRIALEHMGRAYVDDDGRVYPSKQEFLGQQPLL